MGLRSNKSEEVVRQYALALNTLDLKPIVHLLHPEFKFVYRMLNGSGHGIRTDVRYIGHLYKTFEAMKADGITEIKTDFFYSDIDGEKILCIKLLPPHSREIIFPMDFQLIDEVKNKIPLTDVCLLPRVIKGLLCKVECYQSMQAFNSYVEGTFKRLN